MKKPTSETQVHFGRLGMAITLAIFVCAVFLAIRLEQEKAEKERVISMLNELRTMREWGMEGGGR